MQLESCNSNAYNFKIPSQNLLYHSLKQEASKQTKTSQNYVKQEELEWTPAIKIEKQTCNNRPLQKCFQFIISEYVEYFWAHITTPT